VWIEVYYSTGESSKERICGKSVVWAANGKEYACEVGLTGRMKAKEFLFAEYNRLVGAEGMATTSGQIYKLPEKRVFSFPSSFPFDQDRQHLDPMAQPSFPISSYPKHEFQESWVLALSLLEMGFS